MFAARLDARLPPSEGPPASYRLAVILDLSSPGPAEDRWRSRKERVEYVTRFSSPYSWLDGSPSDRVEQFAQAILAAIRSTEPAHVSAAELAVMAEAVEAVRSELLGAPSSG